MANMTILGALGLHCNGDRRISCERLLRHMIFRRHNGVLAPVLPIPACRRENALLFGKGCANLVSGSATRESIPPRALVDPL
jgi:hypothetical protein